MVDFLGFFPQQDHQRWGYSTRDGDIAPWKDFKRFERDWTDPGTDGRLDHRQAGANNLNILSLRGYLPVLT